MATTFLHGLGKNSVSLWSNTQALMLLPKCCKQEVLLLLCESESDYLLRELYIYKSYLDFSVQSIYLTFQGFWLSLMAFTHLSKITGEYTK